MKLGQEGVTRGAVPGRARGRRVSWTTWLPGAVRSRGSVWLTWQQAMGAVTLGAST